MRSVAVLALALLGAHVARGEVKTYVGAGGPVRDGTIVPITTRFELFVPDHGNIIDVRAMELDIVHTWVGDLTITLVKKDSAGGPLLATVTLLDRPGVPPSVFGNSSDLNGVYSFEVGGLPFPETRVGPVVPPGAYALHENGTYDAFRALDKFGVWSLVIADSAGENIGTLTSWRLVVDNVPEPGGAAALVCGVALIGLHRRR